MCLLKSGGKMKKLIVLLLLTVSLKAYSADPVQVEFVFEDEFSFLSLSENESSTLKQAINNVVTEYLPCENVKFIFLESAYSNSKTLKGLSASCDSSAYFVRKKIEGFSVSYYVLPKTNSYGGGPRYINSIIFQVNKNEQVKIEWTYDNWHDSDSDDLNINVTFFNS